MEVGEYCMKEMEDGEVNNRISVVVRNSIYLFLPNVVLYL